MQAATRLIASNRAPDSLKESIIVSLLCFVLVAAQGATLIHTHDDKPQRQAECEFCLKLNSSEDAVVSSELGIELTKRSELVPETIQSRHYLAYLSKKARAPPLTVK
ncbi:MAG TPA: hypothetical protein DCM64_09655 [Gammaproteobacteria bacterium]|jgi:hypothetical protein|nr:hypothetical protein [Gammaproteobacteria bacterium]|tara:strand:- start:2764 stop:3084 length:321 start_codon:yes stop_codon:yes gene_type:complete